VDARNDNNLLFVSACAREPRANLSCWVKTHIVLLGNLADMIDDLETSSRVETRGRFIQKQDPWPRDELASNTYSPFLASAHSLAKRTSDQSISLALKAKRHEQVIDTSLTLFFGDCRRQRQLGGKVERLANCEGAHKSVFLLDIAAETTKVG